MTKVILTAPHRPSMVLTSRSNFLLPAARTMELPPLGWTVIPHGITVEYVTDGDSQDRTGVILSTPGAMENGLIVDCTLAATDGELVTRVFNLMNERTRIRRGTVVSQLVIL